MWEVVEQKRHPKTEMALFYSSGTSRRAFGYMLQTPARRFHWNKTKLFPFSNVFSFNHILFGALPVSVSCGLCSMYSIVQYSIVIVIVIEVIFETEINGMKHQSRKAPKHPVLRTGVAGGGHLRWLLFVETDMSLASLTSLAYAPHFFH